jgi:hypothetical protein
MLFLQIMQSLYYISQIIKWIEILEIFSLIEIRYANKLFFYFEVRLEGLSLL